MIGLTSFIFGTAMVASTVMAQGIPSVVITIESCQNGNSDCKNQTLDQPLNGALQLNGVPASTCFLTSASGVDINSVTCYTFLKDVVAGPTFAANSPADLSQSGPLYAVSCNSSSDATSSSSSTSNSASSTSSSLSSSSTGVSNLTMTTSSAPVSSSSVVTTINGVTTTVPVAVTPPIATSGIPTPTISAAGNGTHSNSAAGSFHQSGPFAVLAGLGAAAAIFAF